MKILIGILTLILIGFFGQGKSEIDIKSEIDFYPYINYVSVGPIKQNQDETFTFYRIVTTLTEIYTSVYLELLETDDEYIKKNVLAIIKIPAESFILPNHKGEVLINDFKVDRWITHDSLHVKANDRNYALFLQQPPLETRVHLVK